MVLMSTGCEFAVVFFLVLLEVLATVTCAAWVAVDS